MIDFPAGMPPGVYRIVQGYKIDSASRMMVEQVLEEQMLWLSTLEQIKNKFFCRQQWMLENWEAHELMKVLAIHY